MQASAGRGLEVNFWYWIYADHEKKIPTNAGCGPRRLCRDVHGDPARRSQGIWYCVHSTRSVEGVQRKPSGWIGPAGGLRPAVRFLLQEQVHREIRSDYALSNIVRFLHLRSSLLRLASPLAWAPETCTVWQRRILSPHARQQNLD